MSIKKSFSFFRKTTVFSLLICALLVLSTVMPLLNAQLTLPRDLTGTWQSSTSGTYYELDAFGTSILATSRVTGTLPWT